MRKFQFRFEQLLHYRRSLEEEAKTKMLEARALVLQFETEIERLQRRRAEQLQHSSYSFEDRLALNEMLGRLDSQERHLSIQRSVAEADFEVQQKLWFSARREVKTLEKLKEAALEEWRLNATRTEQAELDEWAVLRRAS